MGGILQHAALWPCCPLISDILRFFAVEKRLWLFTPLRITVSKDVDDVPSLAGAALLDRDSVLSEIDDFMVPGVLMRALQFMESWVLKSSCRTERGGEEVKSQVKTEWRRRGRLAGWTDVDIWNSSGLSPSLQS